MAFKGSDDSPQFRVRIIETGETGTVMSHRHTDQGNHGTCPVRLDSRHTPWRAVRPCEWEVIAEDWQTLKNGKTV
jgi:hypothetical protein